MTLIEAILTLGLWAIMASGALGNVSVERQKAVALSHVNVINQIMNKSVEYCNDNQACDGDTVAILETDEGLDAATVSLAGDYNITVAGSGQTFTITDATVFIPQALNGYHDVNGIFGYNANDTELCASVSGVYKASGSC